MDKLLAMKMFVTTVEAKGFSGAARQLGVAPSSVTRMVDRLEAELATVLVNRSTRQVSVSEAGMAYYQRARAILDSVIEADEAVQDDTGEPSGPLRVSLGTTFGRCIIAPHIGNFLQRYPKLHVDITLTDDIVDLFAERVDLSIRLGSASPMEDIISRPIGQFRRKVVASPDYLQQYGQPSQPVGLLQHNCFRFDYGQAPQVWTFNQADNEQRIPVQGRMKSNSIELLREAVLAGQGIGLLPDWLIDEDIKQHRLVPLFGDFMVNPNNSSGFISALYLPNHRGSQRINAFIQFIRSILPLPIVAV